MSPSQSIIGIGGIKVEKVITTNPLRIVCRLERRPDCPRCGVSRVWVKSSFIRTVRHVSIGDRRSELLLRSNKFHCQGCKSYFNTKFPGVLPYLRSTESFRKEIFERHHEGVAQNRLSELVHISAATIERWYQDFLRRYLVETKNIPCPRVLGVDEHFFSRQKGYATTFADLTKRRVYDVQLGRSHESLKPFLNRLEGKDRVRVAVIDLSETYRTIIKQTFPNAMIVADRFHVVRLIIHRFMLAWKQLDPIGRNNRGLVSLMRRHSSNLSKEQQQRLGHYLNSKPGLKIIYDFKEELVQLMLIKHQTARNCRRLIPRFLQALAELNQCPIEPLKKLGLSLQNWQEEIVRMWRFTQTNSTLEGLHNKMEVISRRAYGFRNLYCTHLRR
jgi:transposase